MLWFVTAGPITKLFEWGVGTGALSQGAPSMRQDEATTTSTGSTTEIHHVCPQQLYFVLPSYTLVLLLFRDCCLLVLNSVTSTPQWIRQP